MLVEAHCKINLGLEVLSRRADGYHEIDTVFQSVSLSDTVELAPAPGGIALLTSGLPVPSGMGNLSWRAAQAVRDATGCPPVSVRLEKRIPVGAGLGGGSADAAAVIAGVNALFDLGLDGQALESIALSVGSDVPFLIAGGTARARGRGELIEPLPPLSGVTFVLATPPFEVSAGDAYAAVRFGLTKRMGFTKLICSAIRDREPGALVGALGNDLEPGVVRMHPEVGRLRDHLRERGASGVVMSGSGPTVVAVVRLRQEAEDLAGSLRGWNGRVHVAEPAPSGCVITRP